MFKVCGITDISKIEFFHFSVTERVETPLKPFFEENCDYVHGSLTVAPTKFCPYNYFIASNIWLKFQLNWLGRIEVMKQTSNSFYPKIVFIYQRQILENSK